MSEEFWAEWKRLTRFLESGGLAFARERNLWASLELKGADQVELTHPNGRYEVSLPDHIEAISDDETFYASVLLHSYALAESAAADRLGGDSRDLGGIEVWGERLLNGNDADWPEGDGGGKPGAVEVAVVRNCFAHSSLVIDQSAYERLAAVGDTRRPVGSRVTLSYDELVAYRHRLKMLMRRGGIEARAA